MINRVQGLVLGFFAFAWIGLTVIGLVMLAGHRRGGVWGEL